MTRAFDWFSTRLTLEREGGLLKGAQESNGTVAQQSADLNARFDTGKSFLGIPTIAVGSDIDPMSRV